MLLFALAHGAFFAGVAATFAMALGTAITVSALAILTLYSKRLALTAVGARQHWVEAAYRGLGLLGAGLLVALGRSEEHTSELQSLMRISYAVFCLKKKTKQ